MEREPIKYRSTINKIFKQYDKYNKRDHLIQKRIGDLDGVYDPLPLYCVIKDGVFMTVYESRTIKVRKLR